MVMLHPYCTPPSPTTYMKGNAKQANRPPLPLTHTHTTLSRSHMVTYRNALQHLFDKTQSPFQHLAYLAITSTEITCGVLMLHAMECHHLYQEHPVWLPLEQEARE